MAMEWKIMAVMVETAEEGVKGWEPFAAVRDDDGNDLILCKALVEVEDGKSSTLPENQNWAGNEPDANAD